jgi:hypothetical protein
MELFIRIVDGQPFEHPMLGDNFRQAFPHVDVNNLPPEFARFVRVPCPAPDDGFMIASATCTYQWVDGIVKDVWEIVQEPIPQEPPPEA